MRALAWIGVFVGASVAHAQARPLRDAPVEAASARQLERAQRDARLGRGQLIDVDGDGTQELFVGTEAGELVIFRGSTRQRLGSFGDGRELELAALSQNGLAVVVVMSGGSHTVSYDYFAVRVTATDAAVVGSLSVANAMQWVSLANLDADDDPEIVMVIAEEGRIADAAVRVFDLRGDSMSPMPNTRAARRAFAEPMRAEALRGRQPALRTVLSIYPEDWRVQLAHARRLIARERTAVEPAQWALAHAPSSRRDALTRELGDAAEWDSWPYGLVFESFPCARQVRRVPREALMRWTIESSCVRATRGR